MPKEPWNDPDPQVGDFDAELDHAQAGQIEIHEGNPAATLVLVGAADSKAADD
jgi:hypothetical protein